MSTTTYSRFSKKKERAIIAMVTAVLSLIVHAAINSKSLEVTVCPRDGESCVYIAVGTKEKYEERAE